MMEKFNLWIIVELGVVKYLPSFPDLKEKTRTIPLTLTRPRLRIDPFRYLITSSILYSSFFPIGETELLINFSPNKLNYRFIRVM